MELDNCYCVAQPAEHVKSYTEVRQNLSRPCYQQHSSLPSTASCLPFPRLLPLKIIVPLIGTEIKTEVRLSYCHSINYSTHICPEYHIDALDIILRRNCLLHDTIEGKMTGVKGVRRRISISRTQLLDDLRKRRIYWELKEKAEDQTRLKRHSINRA